MTKISIDKVLKKLVEGEKITVAIKRNYWVVIQLVNCEFPSPRIHTV